MHYDVIIIGAGNAAFCAALAAREKVGKVLVLERAPEADSGGNSRYTAGLMRVAYGGVEDLKKVMPDLGAEEIARTDFGTYTEDQFLDDMARVTEYRCDPDLTEVLVRKSLETVAWMRQKGVRFTAAWGRHRRSRRRSRTFTPRRASTSARRRSDSVRARSSRRRSSPSRRRCSSASVSL